MVSILSSAFLDKYCGFKIPGEVPPAGLSASIIILAGLSTYLLTKNQSKLVADIYLSKRKDFGFVFS